jgi:hypothetical protein
LQFNSFTIKLNGSYLKINTAPRRMTVRIGENFQEPNTKYISSTPMFKEYTPNGGDKTCGEGTI